MLRKPSIQLLYCMKIPPLIISGRKLDTLSQKTNIEWENCVNNNFGECGFSMICHNNKGNDYYYNKRK